MKVPYKICTYALNAKENFHLKICFNIMSDFIDCQNISFNFYDDELKL